MLYKYTLGIKSKAKLESLVCPQAVHATKGVISGRGQGLL